MGKDTALRIYIDLCCLNRPSDDLSHDRNRIESEAVITIIEYCEKGVYTLVGSSVLNLEIENNSDEEKKEKVLSIKKIMMETIELDQEIIQRGFALEEMGFKPFDALHIACSEKAKVDVFLTVDDKILKKALKEKKNIKVKIRNPLHWLEELKGS
jgi:predicted nucleic acid-binding protein